MNSLRDLFLLFGDAFPVLVKIEHPQVASYKPFEFLLEMAPDMDAGRHGLAGANSVHANFQRYQRTTATGQHDGSIAWHGRRSSSQC